MFPGCELIPRCHRCCCSAYAAQARKTRCLLFQLDQVDDYSNHWHYLCKQGITPQTGSSGFSRWRKLPWAEIIPALPTPCRGRWTTDAHPHLLCRLTPHPPILQLILVHAGHRFQQPRHGQGGRELQILGSPGRTESFPHYFSFFILKLVHVQVWQAQLQLWLHKQVCKATCKWTKWKGSP